MVLDPQNLPGFARVDQTAVMAAVDNIKALRDIVGNEHVSQTSADRESHSRDESEHEPNLPDAIVYPDTTAQVSEVLALANEHLIPVVGWGAGTSVEGHTIPIHGGIVVDFRRIQVIYVAVLFSVNSAQTPAYLIGDCGPWYVSFFFTRNRKLFY